MRGGNVCRIESRVLAPLMVIALVACDGGPAPPPPMAPAGSTPDQVRFFCTQLSEKAATDVGFPPDYIAARQRAADATFAACMARNNVKP